MRTFLLTFIFSLFASTAFADLVLEYTYEPADPSQVAASYIVRANGVVVCTPVVAADELECDATALAPGLYNWTLAAVFSTNVEGPESEPYEFEIPIPDPVQPNIITIRFI